MGDLLLAQAARVGDRLPNACRVVTPGMPPGHNVAISVCAMKGVLQAEVDFGHTRTARWIVRTFDMGRGIRASHKHAMMVGARLGWDMPQAKPRVLKRHDKCFVELESNTTGFFIH